MILVRALVVIREAWNKVSPSVGTPTILVLSYENHAIDEFLNELVDAEPRGKLPVINKMIRIGVQSKDHRLQSNSELEACRTSLHVKLKRQKLEHLHDMKDNIYQLLVSEIIMF